MLAVLVAAGGCGGDDGDNASPPQPAIDQAVAERLASTSDSIAESLDQDDVCTAAGRADDLRSQVVEAINAGEIPPRYQEELLSKATELVNEVNCPDTPTTTGGDDDDEDEDDDQGQTTTQEETEPPPTTTTEPTTTEEGSP